MKVVCDHLRQCKKRFPETAKKCLHGTPHEPFYQGAIICTDPEWCPDMEVYVVCIPVPKPKPKKPRTTTPVSVITNALRKIWMWSPERAAVVKRSNGHCEECGDPVAKTKKEQEKKGGKLLEVHHAEPCNLTVLAKLVHARMFPGADKLDALCRECHLKFDETLRREREL